MIKELPKGSIWSVGGIVNSQLTMNAIPLVVSGGVRAGIEDNIWYDEESTTLASNRMIIERILTIANVLGRKPYEQKEACTILGV